MSVDDAMKLFNKDGKINQFIPKEIVSIVGLNGINKLLIKSTDPAAVIKFTQLLSLLDQPPVTAQFPNAPLPPGSPAPSMQSPGTPVEILVVICESEVATSLMSGAQPADINKVLTRPTSALNADLRKLILQRKAGVLMLPTTMVQPNNTAFVELPNLLAEHKIYVLSNPRAGADDKITLDLSTFAGDAQVTVVDGKVSIKSSSAAGKHIKVSPGESVPIDSFPVNDPADAKGQAGKQLQAYVLLSIPFVVQVGPGPYHIVQDVFGRSHIVPGPDPDLMGNPGFAPGGFPGQQPAPANGFNNNNNNGYNNNNNRGNPGGGYPGVAYPGVGGAAPAQ